jgi:hypothetical protein
MQIVDKIFFILLALSSTAFAQSQMSSVRKVPQGIQFNFKDGVSTTIGSAGCSKSDYVCSGTYTPTISSEDCTGTPTAVVFSYIKVGNTVQVSGGYTAQCANSQGIAFNPPIDPDANFALTSDVQGNATANSGTSGVLFHGNANAATKIVRFANRGTSQGASDFIAMQFTYKIK